MDTIIGLGKAGCAIADKFAEYPQYKIFKIDSEALDSKSKNCHLIKRRHTPEEYEKTIRTMKTFFSKTTEDILFPLALPQTSGDDNFVTNAGSIENKGIEFGLNWSDESESGDFSYAISGGPDAALFRIDVIEIPINNPRESKIVSSPAVFADKETGQLAGLWRGGDHGDPYETQNTRMTNQCHDITVFPTKNIAAGACSGNGILFDISDPYNPERIDVVTDTGFAYWHSATFNNDGTKVVFTDEWGGGGRPRCRAWDPLNWGADAIYDIVDNKLVFKSHYKMPAPQLESENCVAHNGSIVPVKGRDIFAQAWYQGGISIMDFTDSANPVEIGYFDRGPVLEDELVTGGYWSVYYYEGKLYGTEIARGLDVFKLLPSEFLSEEDIKSAENARPAAGPKRLFNPQQQIPMEWTDYSASE